MRGFLLFILLLAPKAWSAEDKPLWEYGVGFGYIRYEQYPASDQFSNIALPLDSSENKTRTGMRDLPFMINLGPQIVYDPPNEKWKFKVGLFQATSISGDFIKKI